MKKRAMRKYIPKNTDYCEDCKNIKFIGIAKVELCTGKKSTMRVFKCRYTGSNTYIDSLLCDGCKTCCQKEAL